MTDKEIAEGLVDELCKHYHITHEYDLATAMLGAKWMQKQMIKAACELYEEALYQAKRTGVHGIPQMVNMFKQAMEE